MKQSILRSNMLLLVAAAIWGLAFVAQRVGAQYVGSFTFNAIRFALGSLSLVPLILFSNRKPQVASVSTKKPITLLPAGIIAGCILFIAASLQQLGIVETSAGKAAFITGLYIILVPLIGLFLKHRIQFIVWLGMIFATIGLYFLSVTERLVIVGGDLLILISSFFFALHILIIDYFTNKFDTLKLSATQFLTCSGLSLIMAVFFEKITLESIRLAAIPILYGGICSVGIAYTLQIFGQKHAKPSHAAIILSMETVFGAIGGLLILHENLGVRGYFGCLMMLTGMLLSQLPNMRNNVNFSNEPVN